MKAKKLFVHPGRRQVSLNAQKTLKMARSAHSYVRGSTQNFYIWLESAAGSSVPNGPDVWICGDCHLGNLGPVADANGRVKIAIRDLDQTVVGNPAHDLVRLGLSLATAIRGSDLPGVTTALMLEQMIDGYEGGLVSRNRNNAGSPPKAVHRVLKRAMKRRWRHLAEERIEDVRPEIPLGRRFWPISPAERKEIQATFDAPDVRKLITCLHDRDNKDEVEVLDAAFWMKGCSSLGRMRFAVLVGIGKESHKDERFCLMDIKEAVPPAAPRSTDTRMPSNNAQRIVEGARQLSPYLGERMLAWRLMGKTVVIRELLPQDLKLEMDQLTRDEAIGAARFLASVVGGAHGSQMNAKDRAKWKADLGRHHTKNVDAPSWLWTSIVQLVGIHESAYLEHCEQYALKTGRKIP
jgi:uncharacterized protein (DUF2252 family)